MKTTQSDTDKILTKEVQMLFKDGTSRTSTMLTQKETCYHKNCMARGRVFVIPILSIHNPFYLCNVHWKKFSKTIIHHAKAVRKDSRKYDLLWVDKEATIVNTKELEKLIEDANKWNESQPEE